MSFTPVQLYPWYLLVRRLGGASRAGLDDMEKRILDLQLLRVFFSVDANARTVPWSSLRSLPP
jgi:hypothetical protein